MDLTLCFIGCEVRIIVVASIPMDETSKRIIEDSLALVGVVEAEQVSGSTCRDTELEA